MKLRIKGNSLRLRVSRSELARFQAGGRFAETIHFTAAPEATLTYALESASEPSPVTVRYGSREVTTLLEDRARLWGHRTKSAYIPPSTWGQQVHSRSWSRRTSLALIAATRITATPLRILFPERPADGVTHGFNGSIPPPIPSPEI